MSKATWAIRVWLRRVERLDQSAQSFGHPLRVGGARVTQAREGNPIKSYATARSEFLSVRSNLFPLYRSGGRIRNKRWDRGSRSGPEFQPAYEERIRRRPDADG